MTDDTHERNGSTATDERTVDERAAKMTDGGDTSPAETEIDRERTVSRRLPALFVARRNLRRNRVRSGLAMLGIVIGVVAIASLGVFGSVLQTAFIGSFGDIGDRVIVSPAFDEGVTELTDEDVRRIERVTDDAEVLALSSSQAVVSAGREQTATSVYRTEAMGAVFTAQAGRIPDRLRSDAVVGSDVADRFGIQPGNTITVDGDTYRVVGVLAEQGGFDPIRADQAVFLPARGDTTIDTVVVQADSGQAANASAQAVRAELNDRSRRVSVTELQQVVQQVSSFFDVLNAFLIGIGLISLIVAGVSILNVMLMSTVERREEIGVLRAVGVHRRTVAWTFIVEAALLGVGGGLIGVTLSVVAGGTISWVVLNDPLGFLSVRNGLFILGALLIGLLAAVLSGLYPAWKAANERPVDALRD